MLSKCYVKINKIPQDNLCDNDLIETIWVIQCVEVHMSPFFYKWFIKMKYETYEWSSVSVSERVQK